MHSTAIVLVLSAAGLHAVWNYLVKRSRAKLAFIWCALTVAAVIYLPMALVFSRGAALSPAGWRCVAATGILHAAYFWLLGNAYEAGDLSLVYPVARGTGPLLVPLLAMLFIGERLSVQGVLGISAVVAGIYLVHLRSFNLGAILEPLSALRGGGTLWALGTGAAIAAYSLVDKIGVGVVAPPLYIYLMLAGTWLLLAPLVLIRRRWKVRREWHVNRGPVLLAGLLVVGAYLMVLFALQNANVSYVVAVRQASILFSVWFGTHGLKEGHGRQKWVGAVCIVSGVIGIGLAP
jgi:drug/metabolite transporter (DMT)-like permease